MSWLACILPDAGAANRRVRTLLEPRKLTGWTAQLTLKRRFRAAGCNPVLGLAPQWDSTPSAGRHCPAGCAFVYNPSSAIFRFPAGVMLPVDWVLLLYVALACAWVIR